MAASNVAGPQCLAASCTAPMPSVEVPLDEDQAKRVFRLIDALEDSDDVQDVYANYSVPDEVIERLD